MCVCVCVGVCVCAEGVNYGPLHSQQGVEQYKQAVADAVAQGGKIECGGKVCSLFYIDRVLAFNQHAGQA